MSRELFIYWRTSASTVAEALVAARQLQADLRSRHGALSARLYRRQGDAAEHVTVMEVYADPGGIGAELEAQILRDGDRALQTWCPGGRHVEVFEPDKGKDLAPAPR